MAHAGAKASAVAFWILVNFGGLDVRPGGGETGYFDDLSETWRLAWCCRVCAMLPSTYLVSPGGCGCKKEEGRSARNARYINT